MMRPTMRVRSIAGYSLLFLLFCPEVNAARDPFTVDHADAPSVRDAARYEDIAGEWDGIEPYIEAAQCGGWDTDQSVDGKIAQASGVPGRDGEWNGKVVSGLGLRKDVNGDGNRNNDFSYPDEAIGLTTVCQPGNKKTSRSPWAPTNNDDRPGEIKQPKAPVKFAYPFFQDPPCRWRIKDGDAFRDPPTPLHPDEEFEFGQMSDAPEDRQSPETCQDFCSYLNRFQYTDCLELDQATVEEDGKDVRYPVCNRWGQRYICNDTEVTDGGICTPGTTSLPTENPNATGCKGPSCRCGDGNGAQAGCQRDLFGSDFASFYRRYEGSYERDSVDKQGPDDTANKSGDIACYGFYHEFDPRFVRTEVQDRRCVINFDVKDLRDTQMGRGKDGGGAGNDINPIAAPRTKAGGAADIWDLRLGWGLSFLKKEAKDAEDQNLFRKRYDSDLGNAFLDQGSFDHTSLQIQSPSGSDATKMVRSQRLRAFDETGERIVVRWWQKQQTEAQLLERPPIIHIILPALHPFARLIDAQTGPKPLHAATALDPGGDRSERIDVQVGADADLLTEALNTIARSLLPSLTQEPVPILLPLGYPAEFRARAELWCAWVRDKQHKPTCDDAPPEVEDLMQKLLSYADRIEEVRSLRGTLADEVAAILSLRHKLTAPIVTWMEANLSLYKEAIALQNETAGTVAAAWTTAAEKMQRFHDATNMPWCMNQRYTLPIYSMLDPWLPSRALEDGTNDGGEATGRISADELPNLTVLRIRDFFVDLSGIGVFTGSGGLVIPVFQPVQLRLDLPTPPAPDQDSGIDQPLPNFPSLDPLHDLMTGVLQRIERFVPPVPPDDLRAFAPPDLAALRENETVALQTVRQAQGVIENMDGAYRDFWQSLAPLQPGDEDGDPESVPSIKEHLQCKQWGQKPCVFDEMSLKEILQRIGSRPLLFLRGDAASASLLPSVPDVCTAQDAVCALLHGESTLPSLRWEVIRNPLLPANTYDALKRDVQKAVLPEPLGDVPPEDTLPFDVRIDDILPALTPSLPLPIDLTSPPTRP